MKLSPSRIKYTFVITASLACLAVVSVASTGSPASARARASMRKMTTAEAVRDTARLGLNSDAAAVAGLSAEQLQSLIQDGIAYFTASGAQLRTADSEVAAAREDLNKTERDCSSGRANAETLAAAQTRLNAAVTSREALLSAAFSEVTHNLAADKVALLQRIAANRKYELPVEYLVVEHSAAEWAQLKTQFHDHVAFRQATAVGAFGDANPAERLGSTLAQADASDAVTTAKAALANAPALDAVWQEALAANR